MTAQNRAKDAGLKLVVAFGGELLVHGWCDQHATPTSLTITDGAGTKRMLNAVRIVRTGAESSPGAAAGIDRGFIVAFSLNEFVGIDLLGGKVRVEVSLSRGVKISAVVQVATLRTAKEDVSSLIDLLTLAASAGIVAPFLASVAELLDGDADLSFITSYAVDHASQSNLGFFVEGWIEEVRSRQFHLISSDGLSLISPSEMLYKVRSDVTAHLIRTGRSPATDDHGFTVSFAPTLPETDSFVVFSVENDRVTPVGRTGVTFSADKARILDLILHSSVSARFPRPEVARSFLLPFYAERPRTPEFETSVIRDSGDPIKVSVVVPLYKEYRFIFSLMLLQKWFPQHYEWVVVCDDPTLHRTVSNIMERRAKFFSNATTLVLNRFNLGYAGANAVGASVARGKHLLFMNSDIWVDSAQPIENAVAVVDRGDYGILGFRLLYEDGSLQHDGMDFRQHSLMHNLLIVDHPGKGAPPRVNDVDTVVEAPAVTGALMLTSKALFVELGGFDRAFIKGDFEDADLCLRAKKLGRKVGLYRTNAIFHLERQSIRLMGPDSTRSALVYLNCITFNSRWRHSILPAAARV